MSEYIYRPSPFFDCIELEERDKTNPIDWYGTLHGEIVRCRDCKWFLPDNKYDDSCRWFCRSIKDENGFCAWGKRKEGGDD